tara:strand:+ start:367 stop:2373 length:2007 start_codon:yes stop_codon:yes gene_type:complete
MRVTEDGAVLISRDELATALYETGLRGDSLKFALAIAIGESGPATGNITEDAEAQLNAFNPKDADWSLGSFQINLNLDDESLAGRYFDLGILDFVPTKDQIKENKEEYHQLAKDWFGAGDVEVSPEVLLERSVGGLSHVLHANGLQETMFNAWSVFDRAEIGHKRIEKWDEWNLTPRWEEATAWADKAIESLPDFARHEMDVGSDEAKQDFQGIVNVEHAQRQRILKLAAQKLYGAGGQFGQTINKIGTLGRRAGWRASRADDAFREVLTELQSDAGIEEESWGEWTEQTEQEFSRRREWAEATQELYGESTPAYTPQLPDFRPISDDATELEVEPSPFDIAPPEDEGTPGFQGPPAEGVPVSTGIIPDYGNDFEFLRDNPDGDVEFEGEIWNIVDLIEAEQRGELGLGFEDTDPQLGLWIDNLYTQTQHFLDSEQGRGIRENDWFQSGEGDEWTQRRLDLIEDVITRVEEIAGVSGLNWTEEQLRTFARDAWLAGWSDDAIRDSISERDDVSFGEDAPTSSDIRSTQNEIRSLYRQYLVDVDPDVIEASTRSIYRGELNIDSVQAGLAAESADLYPGWADRINAGRTPLAILGSYKSIFKSVMGYDPQWDGIHRDLGMELGSGEGNMSGANFARYLRGTEEYDMTPNAINNAYNLVGDIGRTMGVMA